MISLAAWLCVLLFVPFAAPLAGDPPTRDEALKTLLDAAFPDPATPRPETGRELFLAAVGSEAFEHAQVGPFDLHAYRKDGLATHGVSAH